MRPHCNCHPNHEAKYVCETCGFMCKSVHEHANKHHVYKINQAMHEVIQCIYHTNQAKILSAAYNSISKYTKCYADSMRNQIEKEIKELKITTEQKKSECRKDGINALIKAIKLENTVQPFNIIELTNQISTKLATIASKAIQKSITIKNSKQFENINASPAVERKVIIEDECKESTTFKNQSNKDELKYNGLCKNHLCTEEISNPLNKSSLSKSLHPTKLNTISASNL